MTKKRIADLLKEEVEKPGDGSETGTAQTEPETAKTQSRTRKRSSSAASDKASTTKASTAKASTTKASSTKASSTKTSSTKASSAKASTSKTTASETAKASADKGSADKTSEAAERRIKELEALLKASAEQISALQGDVQTHQERIFELKDGLEKAEGENKKKAAQVEKLANELEVAKTTIRQLTESSKAKAEKAAKEEAERVAAEKADAEKAEAEKAEAERVEAEKQAAKKKDEREKSLTLRRARTPYSSYKSIPEYAIQRGTPTGGQSNSMMSDDDIGWVD